MRRILMLVLAAAMACTALWTPALADGYVLDDSYIMPDTEYRDVSKEEFELWDYESLGYILNEIFARHGYVFNAGGKYDNWFRTKSWYTPNANSNNSQACYPKLSSVEWRNERRIKEVREAKRARKDYGGTRSIFNASSPSGISYYEAMRYSPVQGFTAYNFQTGQKLAVYTAPNANSVRGANGKAVTSTNGPVWVAGYESGWLLVTYETNSGSYRVGYTDPGKIKGSKPSGPVLSFEYAQAQMLYDTIITDDPIATATEMGRLRAGQDVTYLTQFFIGRAWAYIETRVNGQLIRGFVPVDSVSHNTVDNDAELDSFYAGDG